MSCAGWLVGTVLLFQVPAPLLDRGDAAELEQERHAIVARETAELEELADRLDGQGAAAAARQVRERVQRPVAPDGATRFVPLPELVAPGATGPLSAPEGQKEIQSRCALAFFALAERAAKSPTPRYALASVCLRAVLERKPEHAEARRLLGYVPHEAGWARPFAVSELKKGNVNHPTFGWVPADWVPHLDRGELPAPFSGRGQSKTRWLPAGEADRLRAGWDPPWKFATEHFEIQTNVPLSEAISFGRRLEAFHDLFMTLFADILGENLPLVRRYKDPALAGDGPSASKLHKVVYFASKDEFVEHLTPQKGAQIADSLGFYDPPKKGSRWAPAYFFRDPGGQIPVTATLYHEVSHQLLFETAGPNAYTKNIGNFWVFEGLGTYFETVTPQPDGALEVGGLVGRRIEAALDSLLSRGHLIRLAEFVAYDENAFKDETQIHLNYQQAMTLAVFLMQWHQGTYRDAFLDYVRDAYRGRLKRSAGRALEDRLGQPYATIESQFLAFLKNGRARLAGEPAGAKPAPARAIRTVPDR
jgi:hypothetical protein